MIETRRKEKKKNRKKRNERDDSSFLSERRVEYSGAFERTYGLMIPIPVLRNENTQRELF